MIRRSRPDSAGRYRSNPVTIGGSEYAPPVPGFVPESVDALLSDYASRRDDEHPVILAADLHQGIVDVHPFEHGNGRTARLAMNLHLMQYGYPLTIVPPQDADRYVESIQLTRNAANANAFRTFLIEAVRRKSDRYLGALDATDEQPDS